MSRGRQPYCGESYLDPATDWDVAMRDALHHESVAALQHQIEVERQQKAAMEKTDYFFTVGILGFAFGLGYGTGGLRPKLPKWMR